MFAENNPAGIKAFLAEAAIGANNFRLPVVPVSEATNNAIKDFVKNY